MEPKTKRRRKPSRSSSSHYFLSWGPDGLGEKVKAAAKLRGMNVAEWVRDACWHHLVRQEQARDQRFADADNWTGGAK